jgi:hypothetical protein
VEDELEDDDLNFGYNEVAHGIPADLFDMDTIVLPIRINHQWLTVVVSNLSLNVCTPNASLDDSSTGLVQ